MFLCQIVIMVVVPRQQKNSREIWFNRSIVPYKLVWVAWSEILSSLDPINGSHGFYR